MREILTGWLLSQSVCEMHVCRSKFDLISLTLLIPFSICHCPCPASALQSSAPPSPVHSLVRFCPRPSSLSRSAAVVAVNTVQLDLFPAPSRFGALSEGSVATAGADTVRRRSRSKTGLCSLGAPQPSHSAAVLPECSLRVPPVSDRGAHLAVASGRVWQEAGRVASRLIVWKIAGHKF